MRASKLLLAAAILTMPPAFMAGGFNGFSLLGVLLVVLSIGFAVGHMVRTAPLEAGYYSTLDHLDGLDEHDARMRAEVRL